MNRYILNASRNKSNLPKDSNFGKKYYNEEYYNARFYEDIDPYLKYLLLDLVTEENSLNKKDIRILDVGCGIGVYVNFLKKEGFSIYGIDFSLSALQMSKQICASGTQIPFKQNSFNYIISAHLIEHLTQNQVKSMLAECHRVLKEKGKLFLLTPNGRCPARFVLKKSWFKDLSHINIYTPIKIKKILEENKFKNIKFMHKLPLNLQKNINKKFIVSYYGLDKVFNKLPFLQDLLFFLLTVTPLAYFRDVIYVSSEVVKKV